MPATPRPMTPDDVPAVARVQVDTFADLDRRFGLTFEPPPDLTPLHARIHHLVDTDPGGAWVTEVDGAIQGAALALLREGLWGLSLLVVSPSHQSAGLGRSLLERTLEYGADAPAGLIVSSADPRALRAYHRAGFDMRPYMDAVGRVRRRPGPEPAVREVRWPEDRELVDAAGRFTRGAGHGRDVPAWLAAGGHVHVHDGGGFAVRIGGAVKVVAAHDPDVAAALLRAALRDVPEGAEAHAGFVAADQEWAVATVHEAGMDLRPAGALMARGRTGPLAPYLPSGAYL